MLIHIIFLFGSDGICCRQHIPARSQKLYQYKLQFK